MQEKYKIFFQIEPPDDFLVQNIRVKILDDGYLTEAQEKYVRERLKL